MQAAEAIERGLGRVNGAISCGKIAVADGGEGTVDALMSVLGGECRCRTVIGPMGERVNASYAMLSDGETAVVEVAASSGLTLVSSERRNPMQATSFGFGELIMAALASGAKNIICGLGGSATIDGGMGMAQALGYRFLDVQGNEISSPGRGDLLDQVHAIDVTAVSHRVMESSFIAACDVRNPVMGEQGAVPVYGPQKGATEVMCRKLEHGLGQFCQIVEQSRNASAKEMNGAGAAGGLGFALAQFAGAELRSGFTLIAEMTGLEKKMAQSDLVITGEGTIDGQTAFGKAPIGIAEIAQRHKVPVVAIGGSLTRENRQLFQQGFSGLEASVTEITTEEQQLQYAEANLSDAAERVMRLIRLGQRLGNR